VILQASKGDLLKLSCHRFSAESGRFQIPAARDNATLRWFSSYAHIRVSRVEDKALVVAYSHRSLIPHFEFVATVDLSMDSPSSDIGPYQSEVARGKEIYHRVEVEVEKSSE
jgi:hypothetical protein